MKKYDVVIIGSGPAGLTTALYTAREGFSTLVIEKGAVGGLMATIHQIDNYPGADGISGRELSENIWKQAERFGAELAHTEVVECCKNNNVVKITTNDGEIKAKSVLVATGNSYKKLGIIGDERVHYCATCDGPFYKDQNLVVIGGANSAIQGAIFLSRFAKHIDLVVRSKLTASKVLVDDLKKHTKKIDIHLNTEAKEVVIEDNKVVGLKTAAGKILPTDGVFVFIGTVPRSESLNGLQIQLNAEGYVKTDKNLMTNIPGIFAAGDIRADNVKQIAVAVGEGATAAHSIRKYLESGI